VSGDWVIDNDRNKVKVWNVLGQGVPSLKRYENPPDSVDVVNFVRTLSTADAIEGVLFDFDESGNYIWKRKVAQSPIRTADGNWKSEYRVVETPVRAIAGKICNGNWNRYIRSHSPYQLNLMN
jgi:hypothetical protein